MMIIIIVIIRAEGKRPLCNLSIVGARMFPRGFTGFGGIKGFLRPPKWVLVTPAHFEGAFGLTPGFFSAFPEEVVAAIAGSSWLFSSSLIPKTLAGCCCQDFLMTKFKAQVFRRVYLWTCEIRLPLRRGCVRTQTGEEGVDGITIISRFTYLCPLSS